MDVRVRSGGWSVGLDIGGSKVLGVVLDPSGAVRHQVRSGTVRGLEGVVTGAVAAVEELAGAAGVAVDDLVGVGLGLPGVVDVAAGTVEHAVNLGIDARVGLAALVAERLGTVPVRLENDLNAAVVGAARFVEPHTDGTAGAAGAAGTAGANAHDLAFLALGTGMAAGLLLDGRLRRGSQGAAGEIGHLTFVPDGLPCKCGQAGCLEQYASGSALDAVWPSRTGAPAPAEVFAAAAAGDERAVALRDQFAEAVAAGVRVLVLTCDVRHVVIGGGVSAVGQPLLDAVRGVLDTAARTSPFLASMGLAERVTLAPAQVPVGAVGAALVGRGEYGA